jgi:hypothetical protein
VNRERTLAECNCLRLHGLSAAAAVYVCGWVGPARDVAMGVTGRGARRSVTELNAAEDVVAGRRLT